MTAPLRRPDELRAVQLYGEGLSLREVGERLGVSHTTVRLLLAGAGAPIRPRHLRVVDEVPSRQQLAPLQVPVGDPSIAYTADRGWHMAATPPAWFLDLLAELD